MRPSDRRAQVARSLGEIGAKLIEGQITVSDVVSMAAAAEAGLDLDTAASATVGERFAAAREAQWRGMLSEVERLESKGHRRWAIGLVARQYSDGDPHLAESYARQLRRLRSKVR
jgi:hypothetical protein